MSKPHLRFSRRAFTLVELLVVIAIIGILVALLLPAVQAAREAGRRTTCQNNFKQLGLAMMNYHDAHKAFAPGHLGSTSANEASWMTLILPHVEEQSLYDLYDRKLGWASGTNANVTVSEQSNISVQLCPTSDHDRQDLGNYKGGLGDYAGINGCGSYNWDGILIPNGWGEGQGYAMGVLVRVNPSYVPTKESVANAITVAQITDGTRYTILVGESAGRDDGNDRFWGNPGQTFVHHEAVLNPYNSAGNKVGNEMRSDHVDGIYSVFADGHVQWFADNTSERVIDFMTTRNVGEILEGEASFD